LNFLCRRSGTIRPEEFLLGSSVAFVVYSFLPLQTRNVAQNVQFRFKAVEIIGSSTSLEFFNSEDGATIRNFFSDEKSGSFAHPGKDSGIFSYLPHTVITYVIANPSKKTNLILSRMNITDNSYCSDDSIERFVVNEEVSPSLLMAQGGQGEMKKSR